MNAQLKGQVIRVSGTSYLVLDNDAGSPDWFWVRSIDPARQRVRMHRDEISRSLQAMAPARAARR
jgi:hypothetical protein